MNDRSLTRPAAVLAAALSLAAAAQAAGTVEVRFIEPDRYLDAGRGVIDTARTTRAIDQHLQRLGARLPDGQTLRIDVLEIDLAGNVKPGARGDLRVVRGGADWPRITLRYSLEAGAATLRSGEEQLADLNYLGTPPRSATRGVLPYEERMLSRWFEASVLTPRAQ